jgi:UDP-glucose 4-epimerase
MRCFSYVDDCLACLVKMGFQAGLSGQTINIGPDEDPITINELARVIGGVTGYTGEPPFYMPDRPREVKVALCSSNKARRLLGYQTKTPLRAGLESMCAAMRAKGTRSFQYHLPLEIVTNAIPRTWLDRLF